MSLNQKYTWKDFLKEHPDWKAKGTKRTSPEGVKAFEAAFKKHVKEYLKKRTEGIDVMKKKATVKRDAIIAKKKKATKAKAWPKAHQFDAQVGRQDAWLGRLDAQVTRTKNLQKNF